MAFKVVLLAVVAVIALSECRYTGVSSMERTEGSWEAESNSKNEMVLPKGKNDEETAPVFHLSTYLYPPASRRDDQSYSDYLLNKNRRQQELDHIVMRARDQDMGTSDSEWKPNLDESDSDNSWLNIKTSQNTAPEWTRARSVEHHNEMGNDMMNPDVENDSRITHDNY